MKVRGQPFYAITVIVLLVVAEQIFLPTVLFRAGPAVPITPVPTVPLTVTLTQTPTQTGTPTATSTFTATPTATSTSTATATATGTVIAPPTAELVRALANSTFSPQSVTINSGETVRWENAGGFHNVVADDSSFSSGAPSSSAWSLEFTFNTPGTFRYHCQIHGGPNGIGMSGTVIVQ